MGELALRMVASLAVVVGLLIVAARVAGRRFRGGTGAEIQILQRQAISRGTQIAVVQVRDRVLVVGATEQQMRLLAELDPADDASTLEEVRPAASDPAPEIQAEPAALASVTPLTLVSTPAEEPAETPTAEAPTAEGAAASAVEILASATGPYADFAAALAEQLAATAGAPAAPAVTAAAGPLTGGRIAPTDPFAPRLDRPGKHARRIEEDRPTAASVLAPAAPAGIDPALALLTDLDDRAALLDLLAAMPASADAPLSTPAAGERTRRGKATRRAAKAAREPKPPKPAKQPTTAALAPSSAAEGRLAGSVLSPQTWRQAYQAVTRRAS